VPDIFISYATADKALAEQLHRQLEKAGLSVFMAAFSIQPGEKWSPAIWEALKASWGMVFLASRTASGSGYVQQELGSAISSGKVLVPVLVDVSPAELPGWARDFQGSTWWRCPTASGNPSLPISPGSRRAGRGGPKRDGQRHAG
jgi:hypothetical protein